MPLNKKKTEEKKNKTDEMIKQDNSATETVKDLKNIVITETQKNKGGRPKLSEADKRKKYTLTLSKNTYERFLSVAHNNNISLSVLLENATEEYIKNNNLC